jgi:hypothetical protein
MLLLCATNAISRVQRFEAELLSALSISRAPQLTYELNNTYLASDMC